MFLDKGLFYEEELSNSLNNKKYTELSNNGRYLIQKMFGHVNDNEVIHAARVGGYMKPDIMITVGNTTRYLSMKYGMSVKVHEELVAQFCNFLKSQGVSERTIETILLFQYGDGTTDGTGKERHDFNQITYQLRDRIKDANIELNSNKNLLVTLIYRLVFQGADPNNISADYLYHGDTEFGEIASKEQILAYIFHHSWNGYNNLHIGPILLHAHARYVGTEIKSEKRRATMDFKWPNLFASIRMIANRYNQVNKR